MNSAVKVNPILRRLLALAVLASVLNVLWFVIVVPVRVVVRSQTDWRSDVRRELARERGTAALEETVHQQLVALKDAAIWKRLYATSGATGALEQDITRLVTAAGGSVSSMVALPVRNQAQLEEYGVQLATTLSIDQLKSFLSSMRMHAKYLRVQRLTISAPLSQPANANPPLLVKLEICGYAARGRAGT